MSHNNSYGNFADRYLNECLPNIRGKVIQRANVRDPLGDPPENYPVFSVVANNKANTAYVMKGEQNTFFVSYSLIFDASQASYHYRDYCYAVRPKSYGVYIWIRTS